MTTCSLILAGGAGTRLWPLSTDEFPKQFLPLFGNESLIQKTFARARKLVAVDRIFVSTNERYRDLVLQQLPELNPENVLVEPSRRNTGPAVAVCCFEIERRIGDATLAMFHSDAAIRDEAAFLETIRTAIAFAQKNDFLVTVAIRATEPNTGYGYLELGERLAPEVLKLSRFVEKPGLDRAKEFLASGNFAWNGGIFVWRLSTFRAVANAVAEEIAVGAERYLDAPVQLRRTAYETMPSISIDHAVMEKAPKVAAVRGDFGWSDVGSWAAVAELAPEAGNVFPLHATSHFVHAPGRDVAVVGFDNVAVIESPRGILVLNMQRSEGLSDLVKKIEASRKE